MHAARPASVNSHEGALLLPLFIMIFILVDIFSEIRFPILFILQYFLSKVLCIVHHSQRILCIAKAVLLYTNPFVLHLQDTTS